MEANINTSARHAPWNKGKLVGQKAPLKLREIWAIRTRLQMAHRVRDLALFNMKACNVILAQFLSIAMIFAMTTRVEHRDWGKPMDSLGSEPLFGKDEGPHPGGELTMCCTTISLFFGQKQPFAQNSNRSACPLRPG